MKFLPVDDFVGFKIRVCEVLVGYHQEFSVTQSENENHAISLKEKCRIFKMTLSGINFPEIDEIALLKILRQKEKKEVSPFIIYSSECSKALKNIGKKFNEC